MRQVGRDEVDVADLVQVALFVETAAVGHFNRVGPRRIGPLHQLEARDFARLDTNRDRLLQSEELDAKVYGLAERLADPATRDPEQEASRGDLGAALEAAVALLRPEYREVVLLRFAEGLSYQDVAQVTGLPVGTVKTYIHRARKEMAATLSAGGWRP